MAADYTKNHRDLTAETRDQSGPGTRPPLPRATAAIRRTQDTGQKELPQLQLRVLSPVAKARLQTVLYVFSIDQEQPEAPTVRRDVGEDGEVDQLAEPATRTGPSVLRKTL